MISMPAGLSSVTKNKAIASQIKILAWMLLQKPENGTEYIT